MSPKTALLVLLIFMLVLMSLLTAALARNVNLAKKKGGRPVPHGTLGVLIGTGGTLLTLTTVILAIFSPE